MNSYSMKFYVCVLFFSALFLFAGNRIASLGAQPMPAGYDPEIVSGVITQIIDREETQHGLDPEFSFTNTTVTFMARLTSGPSRGTEVVAEHSLSTVLLLVEREVAVGDRILMIYDQFNSRYYFTNYVRINYVLILGGIFFVLIILFGKRTGLNSIVALGFTCGSVFFVFIPAILAGRNIYATTVVICVYAIVSTLLIVIGPTKKALTAMLGCLGGVLLAGLIMVIMNIVLNLTGFVDEETQFLLLLPLENPIDLRAIIFAGVIIGSVGAIMDVAMSIASSLWELKITGGASNFQELFDSGINIGKDTLGTMLNTLILAYIGSSLSLILLITAHTTSMLDLFNLEMVLVELLRAIIGSFGMLLAIPLTAGICGWLYTRPDRSDQ
ncbi:MAG: YibE/F family protein [Defluviitaleaceae bacterium]|nr:YibE/F family protein [Defluviitaleaceae bacterium]